MSEFDYKQSRIRTLLAEHKLDVLLLRRVSSFAWATCGAASHINTAATQGEAALLITPSDRFLVTNNIESPRLLMEERLEDQGWELRVSKWHEPADPVAGLTSGLRLGADGPYPGAVDLSADLARLRANLTSEEGERFRALARQSAEAMDSAARALRPGQSEYEIAALLAAEAEQRGVQPIVILIAADERIHAFRHPLPTSKQLERYAMLVLCGRRWGLVCSLTRLVHFGHLPDDLRRKVEAVAQVDGAFLAATRPGATLGEIFDQAVAAYAAVGFPDEWQLHHQGGPAGYEPREYIARPGSTDLVLSGQVYAWNPSITGTKSEDTILVDDAGNDVLTAIPDWPTMSVCVDGQNFERPAVLEIV